MLIINKRNHVFVTSAKVARNFWNLKAKKFHKTDRAHSRKKSGTELERM